MTISSLGDGNVNSALSVLIPRSLNFKFSLKWTDHLILQQMSSLCKDRITFIFSLIKRNFKKLAFDQKPILWTVLFKKAVTGLQFPTVKLFSLVYPVIQKNISLLFRLWSMKNTKSTKKLIETIGVRGPSTICLFWEWKNNDSELLQHWTLPHITFL